MDKKALRRIMLKIRDDIPSEERQKKSRIIAEKLFSEADFKRSREVFCYLSFRSEVLTGEIIEKAISEGKTAALPLMRGEKGEMVFIKISSLSGLVKNSYGIYEPAYSEENVIYPHKDSLVVVPGAAFSQEGYRLGYGGGYYDRYFAKYSEGLKIGLCFKEQLCTDIPKEEYDIKLDKIISA